MSFTGIENLNVESQTILISPAELKSRLPLTEKAFATVKAGREAVRNILDGTDPRLLVVVGPCSIHDTKAAMEYAGRLKTLADEVKDSLLIVPTVQLYNLENTFRPSVEQIMASRTAAPYVEINAADAARLKIADGDLVQVSAGASTVQARAHVNGAAPEGSVLLPRHLSGAATPLALASGEVRKV